jgi:hypothetical protein
VGVALNHLPDDTFEVKEVNGVPMNKYLPSLRGLVALSLLVAACASGSAVSDNQTGAASASSPSELQAAGTSMDAATRLALGTLRLEDTQLAIQEQQAAELLPLWQVYLNLSSSNTAAQVEMDGLQAQIRSTMTAEQLATIDEMQVDETDMRQLLESLGLSTGFGEWAGAQGTPISGMGGGRGDMPPGDFIFGEGGGGGMGEPGGMAMDGRADPSLQATRQAGMPSRQLGGGNPMLVRAVIELLQRKLPAAEG